MANGTSRSYGAALANLDQFVTELREKQAAELPLGGDQGDKDTTHPSKAVDNQEEAATEGSRSAEHEADISKDVPGVNINDVSPEEAHKPAAMENLTTAETTGKDPAVETASVKTDKDDPGTTHPAEMDGTENGLKSAAEIAEYACAQYGVEKAAAAMTISVMNELLGNSDDVDELSKQAAAAGESDANAMAQEIQENMPQILGNLEKMASVYADHFSSYYGALLEKAAMEEEMMEEEEDGAEAELPPEAMSEGALPEEDIAQLADVAEGEEGVEDVEPEMAGEEEMPMDEAEAMAGEGGEEEVIEALSEALDEAGVTPEELVAAVEGEAAVSEEPIEEKVAHVKSAQQACFEVNAYRNLKACGRLKTVKKASLAQKYAMRQLVTQLTGK